MCDMKPYAAHSYPRHHSPLTTHHSPLSHHGRPVARRLAIYEKDFLAAHAGELRHKTEAHDPVVLLLAGRDGEDVLAGGRLLAAARVAVADFDVGVTNDDMSIGVRGLNLLAHPLGKGAGNENVGAAGAPVAVDGRRSGAPG